MGLKSDRWIIEQAKEGMIQPFEANQISKGVISYGISSYGLRYENLQMSLKFLPVPTGKMFQW